MPAIHFHHRAGLGAALAVVFSAIGDAAEEQSNPQSQGLSSSVETVLGVKPADPVALVHAGLFAAAAEAAEQRLSQPSPYQILRDSRGPTGSVWQPRDDGSRHLVESDGWQFLNLAAGPNPAALATRLSGAALKFPGDEGIAFAAFLAVGTARSLTAADLRLLDGLTADGKLRCLAAASQLFPPAVLPAELCQDAWEYEAQRAFRDTSVLALDARQRGLDYLARLDESAATAAIARLIPGLLESVTRAEFKGWQLETVLRRFQRSATTEQNAELQKFLNKWFVQRLDDISSQREIAYALTAFSQTAGIMHLPEIVKHRVTTALQSFRGALPSPGAGPAPEPAYLTSVAADLAYAASADPQWHPLIKKLTAARKGDVEFAQPDSPWPALHQLTNILENGPLLPDADFSVECTRDGKGTLRWSFRGLRLPPAVRTPDLNWLPWPSLAAPLAGQFDAIVKAEDRADGQVRIVARIDAMAAQGSVALGNLPFTGKLRVQLLQRAAPYLTDEAGPIAFTATPILLDTAGPSSPSPAHPRGWHLLSPPAPVDAMADQWLIRSHDGSLPEGTTLLLLDAAGQLCAGSTESAPAPGRAGGLSGMILRQSHFVAGHRFANRPWWQEPQIRSVGPPKFIAVAVPSQAESYQETHFTRPARRPRITVQTWPWKSSAKLPGRLEWQRAWLAESPADWKPAIGLHPFRAAWVNGPRLIVSSLGENDPLLSQRLPVPDGHTLQEMAWQGTRLRLIFTKAGPPADPPHPSTLITIDTAAPATPPAILTFPGLLQLQSPSDHALPDTTVLQKPGAEFIAIFSSDGRQLSLPPGVSPSRLILEWPLPPARYACHKTPDGRIPILDWTDGTLKLEYVTTLPSRIMLWPPPIPLDIRANETLLESTEQGTQTWQRPLELTEAWPTGDGSIIGWNNAQVIRFRKVTTANE